MQKLHLTFIVFFIKIHFSSIRMHSSTFILLLELFCHLTNLRTYFDYKKVKGNNKLEKGRNIQ